jgi:hypothetical protein
MARVVVEHEGLGARVVVDAVAAPDHAPKGWVDLGPWCGVEGSHLTSAEWAAKTAPPRTKKVARSAPQSTQPITESE